MPLIPVSPIPSQTMTLTLDSQPMRLTIYQKSTGLFIDVYMNDLLIAGGVLCLHADAIVRAPYTGFIGEFAFFDTEGQDPPYYTGLGSRWFLDYIPG